MRDVGRIEPFCQRLQKVWEMVPDWRFFQLISNFMSYVGSDCFYTEDDRAIELLEKFVRPVATGGDE